MPWLSEVSETNYVGSIGTNVYEISWPSDAVGLRAIWTMQRAVGVHEAAGCFGTEFFGLHQSVSNAISDNSVIDKLSRMRPSGPGHLDEIILWRRE